MVNKVRFKPVEYNCSPVIKPLAVDLFLLNLLYVFLYHIQIVNNTKLSQFSIKFTVTFFIKLGKQFKNEKYLQDLNTFKRF